MQTESPNKERIKRLRKLVEGRWESCYSPILKGKLIPPQRSEWFLKCHHAFIAIDRIDERRKNNQLISTDQEFENRLIDLLEKRRT